MTSSYTPRYIDIGINLTDPIFTGIYHGKTLHTSDLPDIITRARKVGLQKLLVTGSDLESSRAAIKLAEEHPGFVYATVGVHPCSAKQLEDSADPAKYLSELKTLATSPFVAAFGEIGLDYDRLYHAEADVQRRWFDAQLDVAEELGLPLFLHSRAAADDFEKALKGRRLKGGVVHSFTGTVEEMEGVLKMGMYVGLNGCSMKTEENLEVCRKVPLERLMLESDGPWCEIRPSHASAKVLKEAEGPPEIPGMPAVKKEKFKPGFQVKGRNEPVAVAQVATVISRVKEVSLQDVCEHAWRNSIALFGLGEEEEAKN